MRNVFNFSAGPAMVPEEVLIQAQKEMLDWHGTGSNIMELSHRGKAFKQIVVDSEADLRELMNIPKNYHVLFVGGGASTQFAMVPLNLFDGKNIADYIDTGLWSRKAIAEASRYGSVNVAAKTHFTDHLAHIPPQEHWSLNENATYLHYTPNETIDGIQFHWIPNTGHIPLIADMTSMLLSQPIDVNQFGIIYAGAQKNLGQAGLTVVIVRDDLIKEPLPNTPTLYQYKTYIEHQSLYNTPPTYAWYLAGLVLKWMKEKGGINVFYEANKRKAKKIYAAVDQLKDFYISKVALNDRSIMNVMFYLKQDELTSAFLEEAQKNGLTNLKGHRTSGGVRASIYNAMPEEGVDKLVAFMYDFTKKFG